MSRKIQIHYLVNQRVIISMEDDVCRMFADILEEKIGLRHGDDFVFNISVYGAREEKERVARGIVIYEPFVWASVWMSPHALEFFSGSIIEFSRDQA